MNKDNNTVKKLLSGSGSEIPLFKVFMPKNVIPALRQVLFSGYIGQGPRVDQFEKELGTRFANKNVLALNNGTAAIHLALRLAGAGPDDEVISTPMTCVATNEPVLASGARLVWADIDPQTGNIDPESVKKKITKKTKAVIAVHWGGYPCDLDKLNRITSSNGIRLIEDACHAFGSVYRGRPIGSHSDFVCFSFQAIKEITTADGGALVCRSKKDCERGRLLRWYGIDRTDKRMDYRCENDIKEYGYKFHMNDVSAVIGLIQLKYADRNLEKTRRNAAFYNSAFQGMRNAHPLRYENDRESSFWLYTLRVRNRKRFIRQMQKAHITVSRVHARNDRHTIFKESKVPLPGVDEFSSEHICIPCGWWLKKRDTEYIAAHVIKAAEK